MRKTLLLAVTTFCSITMLASTYAGYCGPRGNEKSLTWFLDTETGVLTFRGSGEEIQVPSQDSWHKHSEHIISVVMPEQIKVIGDFTFGGCQNLSSIKLPPSLTTIGKGAFNRCSSLKTLQLPNTLTAIGKEAFEDCTSLTSLVIPDGITKISYSMCNGCKRLSSIVLSRKITEIEGHAFAKCSSLKSIKIPISCNSIGHSAFMNCTSLSDVRIPINCQKIGDYAFQGCSSLNETFFIPLSVRSIGECAFISTPIKKIYYPFGVSIEKIGLSHEIVNFQVYMDIPDEFAYYYESNANNNEEDNTIYSVPETLPEFPGGKQAMMLYLSENVKYPTIAADNGIQGRAVCSFVVNKDGSISDVEVVRSGGDPSLDKEALRVIKSMPKWKPGTIKGKPVRVKFTLPVNFSLN